MIYLHSLGSAQLQIFETVYGIRLPLIVIFGLLGLLSVIGILSVKMKKREDDEKAGNPSAKIWSGSIVVSGLFLIGVFFASSQYVKFVTAEAPTLETAFLSKQGDLNLFVTHHRKVKNNYESVRLEVSTSETDWAQAMKYELDPKESTADKVTFEEVNVPKTAFRLYARVVSVKRGIEFTGPIKPFAIAWE